MKLMNTLNMKKVFKSQLIPERGLSLNARYVNKHLLNLKLSKDILNLFILEIVFHVKNVKKYTSGKNP